MTEVTKRQAEYLLELKDGPKTTRDLILSQMVSAMSVSKMMRILKDKGLVQTRMIPGSPRSQRVHELTAPYSELPITIVKRKHTTGATVTDEEIRFAAELRKAGLTGQRLVEAHCCRYPKRAPGNVKNVVEIARRGGLCR